MAYLYTFTSSALPDDATLLDFRFDEALNTPFELVVHFQTSSPDDVDLADAIGAKAQLAANRGDGGPQMQWSGTFASIEHIHQVDDVAIFRGLIVPQMWFLHFGEHSRVFTAMSAKDVITQVLQDAGLTTSDFEFRLQGSPATEETIIQYRESDLAFIHRWLEREGLYYYFDFSGDDPKMIITDTTGSDSLRSGPVVYNPTMSHDAMSGEAFQRFRATRRAALSKVKLRDYDYGKPTLDVKGEATGSKTGSTELVRFGDRFFDPSDGARVAKLIADGVLAREEIYIGSGTPLQLRTGYVFELDQHPRVALNKKYFATKLSHRGVHAGVLTKDIADVISANVNETYHVDILEATDASLPYRVPRTTPWPRISGQEIATVDGPTDGEHYAQIDDDGRYLVKFMFDENTHDDGKASTRVRMMQPHAGNPEGFHFPLRKGTEVVIIFLGGDPDRPIIAGAIPQALTPSVVGQRNHTQNIMRTGANNQLVMEDEKGKEFIFLSTPNKSTGVYMGNPAGPQSSIYTGQDKAPDFMKTPDNASPGGAGTVTPTDMSYYPHTTGNAGFYVHGNSTNEIDGNENTFVGTNVSHGYKGTFHLQVGGDTTEDYYSNRAVTTTGTLKDHVKGHVTQNYDTGREQTVGGGDNTCHWTTSATFDSPKLTETFGQVMRTVSGTHTELVNGAESRIMGGAVTWVHGSPTVIVSAPWTHVASGPITMVAPSIKMLQPGSQDFWANHVKMASIDFKYTLVSGSYTVLKLDAAAISLAMSALKIENRGAYMQSKGINLATEGVKISPGGIYAVLKAMVAIA